MKHFDNQDLIELNERETKSMKKAMSFSFFGATIWIAFLLIVVAPSCPDKNAEYYFNYGKHKESEGDNVQAIRFFTKAIEKSPYYYEAYLQRAALNQKQDSFHLSIADYTSLLSFPEMTPARKAELLYIRAGAYYSFLQDSLACKDYKESCELNLPKSCTEFRNKCKK